MGSGAAQADFCDAIYFIKLKSEIRNPAPALVLFGFRISDQKWYPTENETVGTKSR